MPISNSTIAGLMNKGILKRVSNIGDGLYFPLTLSRVADKNLKEFHIGISKDMSEDQIDEIFSNRPEWATDYMYNQLYK